MVAVPWTGDGPYGTLRSARSSTTSAPKLVAAETAKVAQQVDASLSQAAPTSSRRSSWFSRQLNKINNRRSKSESV
ncbi:hypothetical protein N7456_003295 [Penicillium angulare]|uniref:Uncharacterized protein n=1 Tax=Penicillium angulare TaxID=116970 RepID=A0A9W9KHF6_9EURO|nr:hypothetical protein N7456_003295 [Penicillium angulare]